MRKSWDAYFSDMAYLVATRSTCLRANVGAVIVKDNQILSTGYNGAPSGEPHCIDEGCLMENNHCVRTIHAEQNAIAQAAMLGVSIKGANCYTTREPCRVCAGLLKTCQVSPVVV